MMSPTSVPVSIRAPLLRAGRRTARPATHGSRTFQSAPRSCERGDTTPPAARRALGSFNPRPALASGATSFNSSICRLSAQFQSAPRSCERGDTLKAAPVDGSKGFNPRPALASGATPYVINVAAVGRVSIRAPLLRAGRRSPEARQCARDSVSIRAPLLRAGRPPGSCL